MNLSKTNLLAAALSALLISACGGGGNDSVADTNTVPVANAGTAQTVTTGTLVNLDGSASSDADGDTLTYSWTLTPPAGSAAALAGANTATPSFTPDVGGLYVASLIVNDGTVNSAPDTVNITATAPEITQITGTLFVLDTSAAKSGSIAKAHETPGLVPQQPETISISIFDPQTGGYVALGVDLGEGLTLNADGSYELRTAPVSEAVRDAVLERFPDRSISSFLAEDCVLVLTYTDANNVVQTLRVPLVRDVLNVSPLSEFLARQLEAGGDFTNVNVEEVEAILAEVEGVSFSAEGAADLEEVIARIDEIAGPQVRENIAAAQEPAADTATRDTALGIYDLVTMELVFFGAEDPDTGGSGFFGGLNVLTDIFQLELGAGAGNDEVVIVGGQPTEFNELLLGASSDGFGGVNYFLEGGVGQEDLLGDIQNTVGLVRGSGAITFNFPATTFIDAQEGRGDVESAFVLRLQPAGDAGLYTTRALFREAEYELTETDELDLSRRTGRSAGAFFGVLFRQSETPAELSGRYGALGFTVAAENNGNLSLEGLRLERVFNTGGEVVSAGEVRAVERTNGFITAATGSAQGIVESWSIDGRSFQLTDSNGRNLAGRVLDGGAAYAARLQSVDSDAAGNAERVSSDIEFGFRLGETAPDIAGARYRLQHLQFELASGQSNGTAFSQFETISGAVMTIPEGGMQADAVLPFSNLIGDNVARDNDAAALRITSESEEGASLTVSSYDAANSFFELINTGANAADGTLPGFISADGSVIGFATFEELFDENGNTEAGLTGIVIGTRID